ncbi:hypothetical protein [Pseudoroseicyclus tamaricis]|uniref:Uncharacterized protein n=1 Tax=Pseudoroseicyclus tamaricis TaxID=2705421 RepID=A0A6B2K6H1_9RHOB|nr:hypothetical protein [Pseudoroseicyclus tamaricis]NDV02486.1 hypothetical protein [Pseudoroseicyclus tamaricis]
MNILQKLSLVAAIVAVGLISYLAGTRAKQVTFGISSEAELELVNRAMSLFETGKFGRECSFDSGTDLDGLLRLGETARRNAITDCLKGTGTQMLRIERNADQFSASRLCETDGFFYEITEFASIHDLRDEDEGKFESFWGGPGYCIVTSITGDRPFSDD